MQFLTDFANYLWVITKILLMLIFILAVLRTFIGSIFSAFRRRNISNNEED